MARSMSMDDDARADLYDLHLLTLKPTMYIANVAEDGFENNPWLDAVRGLAEKEAAVVVPVCAAIESELVELDEEEQKVFLDELGLEEPAYLRPGCRHGVGALALQDGRPHFLFPGGGGRGSLHRQYRRLRLRHH